MVCEDFRKQVTDYLTDNLVEPEKSEVQDHLASCEACRSEAEALSSIWEKLESIPSPNPDSAGMRARFDVMLEAYCQGAEHSPASTLWGTINSWVEKWWPRQPVLQFGLALTFLVAGVIAGQRPAVSEEPSNQDLDHLRAELRDMRQMFVLSLMQQQSASERLRGVSWSNRIDQPDTQVLSALLDTLMHDPNVNVRLASVDALRKFSERQIVRRRALEALARPDSPLVQVALIDFMVEVQERESMETLRRLTQDSQIDSAVRQRAAWGLEQFQ